MKTKAVVFPAKDQIEIREVETAPLAPDQILTETLYTFVSPGTELRTLAGFYGADKKYPMIPGYSAVCRVIEAGKDVKAYRAGDLLSSRSSGAFVDIATHWGGEAGHHVSAGGPGHAVLPVGEDPLPYAVAEVASISCRGVQLANPEKGEHVLVIGQGMIGAFSAEFFRMKGCIVTVCDVDKRRLAESAAAGFATVDLSEPGAEERLAAFGCGGFDVVSECSGYTQGVKLAYSQIRLGLRDSAARMRCHWPRLLLQATYVEEVPINPAYFFKGEGVAVLTPNDRELDDRKQVVELIRRGELDTRRFTKNIFTPEEMPNAYRQLQNHEINSVVCKWR